MATNEYYKQTAQGPAWTEGDNRRHARFIYPYYTKNFEHQLLCGNPVWLVTDPWCGLMRALVMAIRYDMPNVEAWVLGEIRRLASEET
jgi:hypothetical protein